MPTHTHIGNDKHLIMYVPTIHVHVHVHVHNIHVHVHAVHLFNRYFCITASEKAIQLQ